MNVLDGYTLDTSNYDDPTFDAGCFASSGVKRIIVGTHYEAIADRQVASSLAAGINVMGVYAFLYFGGGQQAADATNRAIRVARRHGVPVIWLDAEADMPGVTLTPAQRNAELRQCIGIVERAGLTPGIYTGGWWWTPKHATSEFANVPLWFSLYGANDGKQKPVRNPGFGGWKTAAVHQYTSSGGLCGRSQRDFNHVWPDAPGLEKENEVTREEYEALVTRMENMELATFAGGEERAGDALLPRADRLRSAAYRIQNAGVTGTDPDTGKPARSVRDIAASAESGSKGGDAQTVRAIGSALAAQLKLAAAAVEHAANNGGGE
jgi:hypothetical protein